MSRVDALLDQIDPEVEFEAEFADYEVGLPERVWIGRRYGITMFASGSSEPVNSVRVTFLDENGFTDHQRHQILNYKITLYHRYTMVDSRILGPQLLINQLNDRGVSVSDTRVTIDLPLRYSTAISRIKIGGYAIPGVIYPIPICEVEGWIDDPWPAEIGVTNSALQSEWFIMVIPSEGKPPPIDVELVDRSPNAESFPFGETSLGPDRVVIFELLGIDVAVVSILEEIGREGIISRLTTDPISLRVGYWLTVPTSIGIEDCPGRQVRFGYFRRAFTGSLFDDDDDW